MILVMVFLIEDQKTSPWMDENHQNKFRMNYKIEMRKIKVLPKIMIANT